MAQRFRLRWYGHVSRNDDGDLMKKCVALEVQGARRRCGPKEENVDKDMKDLHQGMLWIIINGGK